MNGPLLSVRQLGVRFGGVVAVRDVSFDVDRAEILTLIGPNGAGKMLHEAQRTSAPMSFSVSISTAVWIVMCSDPVMRAPASGRCVA